MASHIAVAQRIHDSVTTMLEPHGTLDINHGDSPWNGEELRQHCREADALMAFMTERVDSLFLDHCTDRLHDLLLVDVEAVRFRPLVPEQLVDDAIELSEQTEI